MPIYEYQCDGCQEVFEVRQRMTDPAPKQHACGSTALHRVLSATSFVLKGTGWYATDYGNRSAPPPEGGDGDKASKSGDDPGKTAGAKPEGKAAGTGDKASAKGDKAETSKSSAGASSKASGTAKGGGSPAAT